MKRDQQFSSLFWLVPASKTQAKQWGEVEVAGFYNVCGGTLFVGCPQLLIQYIRRYPPYLADLQLSLKLSCMTQTFKTNIWNPILIPSFRNWLQTYCL
jgi:hypothetical protein